MRITRLFIALTVLGACGPAPGYSALPPATRPTPVAAAPQTGAPTPDGPPTVPPLPVPVAVPASTACVAADLPRVTEGTDYVRRIADAPTWDRLAARPGYNPTGRNEVVKIVFDLEGQTRLYFLESNRWDLHFYFLQSLRQACLDHARFNISEYREQGRRYILATITHWIDTGLYTFELVAGDTLEPSRIAIAFAEARAQLFFGDALRFRPTGPQHEHAVRVMGTSLPSVTPDAVFGSMRYQPVVVGEAYGYVRRMRAPLDLAALRPTDVVVTDDVPEEISPIAALVTSRLQAPLAHVAVLSRNRSTPDMALRGAFDDPRFVALEGQLVRILVTTQDFVVAPATLAEAERSWVSRRPTATSVPLLNTTDARIREVTSLGYADVSVVGAKAAQLGVVTCVHGVVTPGGFAVPFAYYARHLASAHLDAFAAQLVAQDVDGFDARERATKLAFLRGRIEQAPIDPALVTEVRRRVMALPGRRHIFRSSTNAEDLAGFNGAGLYESIVVPASPTEAQVADAIRKVWASVWLERAYAERGYYRVSHLDVAMAILVQPFVSDVIGNGVVVSVNPFDSARPGVFINTQAAGGSVTGAGSDEIPEQFIVYNWAPTAVDDDTIRLEPELLSRSSRTGGAPILTDAEVRDLTRLVMAIREEMGPHLPIDAWDQSQRHGVDIEYMLTRSPRRFVIVQARPYTVNYRVEQTFTSRNATTPSAAE